MFCLTGSRFSMRATILRQGAYGTEANREPDGFAGRQNPDTLEIERDWVPNDTDDVEEGYQGAEHFSLIARGIVGGGIRVVGTTERYTPAGILESEDYVRIHFPANVHLSKRDRVFNIRSDKGVTIWKEEEYDGQPTVFEVLGVTPIMDPFNQHIENEALLQRAEHQNPPQGVIQ